jgi:hypothetical protein
VRTPALHNRPSAAAAAGSGSSKAAMSCIRTHCGTQRHPKQQQEQHERDGCMKRVCSRSGEASPAGPTSTRRLRQSSALRHEPACAAAPPHLLVPRRCHATTCAAGASAAQQHPTTAAPSQRRHPRCRRSRPAGWPRLTSRR